MLEKGFMPDSENGFIHLLGPDYSVVDARRDLYDHAFYLLALAWHARVSGRRSSLALADSLLAFLDNALGADNGGYLEGLPLDDPRNALRRQNPHMHLCEAFLALAEATGDVGYSRYADMIFKLFTEHFFEATSGNIIEYFTDDWQRCPDLGDVVEPGHMMEWSWLIDRYGGLTGQDLNVISDKLYYRAIDIGSDAESGFLVDQVDRNGETQLATRRLWPQTEFIKAAIAQARKGDTDALVVAARLITDFLDTYLNVPVAGTWRDQYDAEGAAISGPIPASSFYHIFCMVSEVHALATALEAQKPAQVPEIHAQSMA
jgi:mannose-6-phosphate isomerase